MSDSTQPIAPINPSTPITREQLIISAPFSAQYYSFWLARGVNGVWHHQQTIYVPQDYPV